MSEPGTQKFHWKKAKQLLNNDFIEKMEAYEFMGPKETAFKSYQTLNYITKNTEGITLKQVEDINMAAGKLFKWLQLATENRKLDIIRRKALVQRERDERDSKIKAKEDREKKREVDLDEAKKKFLEDNKEEIDRYNAYHAAAAAGAEDYGEEDDDDGDDKAKEVPTLPEFDAEEFLENWEAENEQIIIQESTADDIDNDWPLAEEEIESHIKNFWAARADS